MNPQVTAYAIYLAVTIPLIVYVARTLFRHGAVFLRDVFDGRQELAYAVNQLLVVGFYLLNLGYVALLLRTDETIADAAGVFEVVTTRVGIVALILGGLHLTNVWVLNRIRRRAAYERQVAPPVTAQEWTGAAPGGQA